MDLICRICAREYQKYISLAFHIKKTHKMTSKDYYDKFCKKQEEGLCEKDGCYNLTSYCGLFNGYSKYCSRKCGSGRVKGTKLSCKHKESLKKAKKVVEVELVGDMLIEHKHRKEIRKKRSENIRGENHPMFGKHHKLESIQKNKDSNKKKFDSPDYLRKYQMAHSVKPTGPEISIRDLLDIVAPGKYEYVGNFTKWIGGRNPDFISEEDKKVIEVFGDHWHSEKITGRSKVEEEKDRIEGFKKVGFRTLIIWERELNNMNHIAEKIKEFELL